MAAELKIDVKARYAEFRDSLRKIESDTSRVASKIDSAFRAIGSSFSLIGGAGVFGGLVASLGSVSAKLDDLAKASRSVGVTVEQLSALQYGADLAGVSTDELQKALTILSRRLVEAQRGTGEAALAFKTLELDPSKFSSSAEALEAIADKFQKMPDGVRKTALSLDLFSRSGSNLISFLNGGAQGIRDTTQEAENLGLIMSTELAEAAERFRDNLTRIGRAAEGLQIYLAGPFVSTLADITEAFRNTRASGKSWLDSITSIFSANRLESAASEAIVIQERIREINKLLAQETNPQKSLLLGKELEQETRALENYKTLISSIREDFDVAFKPRQPPQKFSEVDDPATSEKSKRNRKEAISDGERLLKQLQDRLYATQDLTAVQSAGIEIARLGSKINEADAAALINIAAKTDEQKRLNEELKAQSELNDLIADAEARATIGLRERIEKVKDLADPFRKTAEAIMEIERTAKEAGGAISEDMVDRAIASFAKADKEVEAYSKSVDDAQRRSRDFWLQIQTGAEDAIFEAKSLKDIMNELFKDYAKFFLRQNLFAPLAQMVGIGPGSGTTGTQSPAPIINRNDSFQPSSSFSSKAIPASQSQVTIKGGDINISGNGVTQGQVAAALKINNRELSAAMLDASKRGKV